MKWNVIAVADERLTTLNLRIELNRKRVVVKLVHHLFALDPRATDGQHR